MKLINQETVKSETSDKLLEEVRGEVRMYVILVRSKEAALH